MSLALQSLVDRFQESKQALNLFDANVWWLVSDRGQLDDVSGMDRSLGIMNAMGCREGMVTYAGCIDYDPVQGNRQLVEQLRSLPNLHGCIVWAPEIGITADRIAPYLDEMTSCNVSAVRMFPKKFNHSMRTWLVDEVLQAMQHRRIPLVLWHMEVPWDTVEDICVRYPDLPVIVEGNDQKLLYHNRNFIPLLKKHSNLYMETHGLIQHGIMEHLVLDHGIDRLIFGSYLPHLDPNAAAAMLTDADIPIEAKRLIGGGNMRGLIRNIKRGK